MSKNSSKSIAKIVNGSEDIIFRNTEENAISATVDDVMMSNVIKNKKEPGLQAVNHTRRATAPSKAANAEMRC